MAEAPDSEDFETMLVSAALDDLVVQELDAMLPNAPDLEERIRTQY